MKKIKKRISMVVAVALAIALVSGCAQSSPKENDDNVLSDDIVLTETGEIIHKYPQPTEEDSKQEAQSASPAETEPAAEGENSGSVEPEEPMKPLVDLKDPEQEQVITKEDQIEPTGSELQIVFLGDSIFDNNRDGTGVPFLTAEACGADAYNLAIGGTSASLEVGESTEASEWTSRSLIGIIRAMKGEIPTDIFAGTRTKEILDNKKIDWAATDYFVVEYGCNDFFRAVPLDEPERRFDQYTYAGALRHAIAQLEELGTDATIILCSPHYARFFDANNWMIGDGNTLNTGYGTLFDYKGICQYVAKESQVAFFDAYFELGIDGYTAEEYLEDGVHLTEAGRKLYAEKLSEIILEIEETKNN